MAATEVEQAHHQQRVSILSNESLESMSMQKMMGIITDENTRVQLFAELIQLAREHKWISSFLLIEVILATLFGTSVILLGTLFALPFFLFATAFVAFIVFVMIEVAFVGTGIVFVAFLFFFPLIIVILSSAAIWAPIFISVLWVAYKSAVLVAEYLTAKKNK